VNLLEEKAMAVREIDLYRFDLNQGSVGIISDEVAADEAVCIFLNERYFRALIASPGMRRELVIGHLFCEGVVESEDEVQEIEMQPAKVYVTLCKEIALDRIMQVRVDLITTACGAPTRPLRTNELGFPKIAFNVELSAQDISLMVRKLNKRGTLFHSTGGVHSAMLCSPDGKCLAFAEDVGRHNAVDKVVGAGILMGVSLCGCVLISSGRQSGEMVLKAARAGIPVIASVSAPLTSGIRIAEAAGITLIGFVRGQRMNVYTHPQRLSINGGV
jgi:FdhD protein